MWSFNCSMELLYGRIKKVDSRYFLQETSPSLPFGSQHKAIRKGDFFAACIVVIYCSFNFSIIHSRAIIVWRMSFITDKSLNRINRTPNDSKVSCRSISFFEHQPNHGCSHQSLLLTLIHGNRNQQYIYSQAPACETQPLKLSI